MKFKDKRNIALVLSGGGIKAAAFHIGVCQALKEKGFHFSGGSLENPVVPTDERLNIRQYVGSSAGAIISAVLASGHPIEDLIEAFQMGSGISSTIKSRFFGNPQRVKPLTYLDIFSVNSANVFRLVPNFLTNRSLVSGGIEALVKNGFKINGLFTTKGIERYLRRHILPTNNFHDLSVDLFIVATQLNHSRKVVFGPIREFILDKEVAWADYAKISDAVAASASLPPVFAPYGIKNEKESTYYYIDGEVRDTLSMHVASDNGADLVIASYSIQPYHYNSVMGSLHNYGIPLILNQALYQVIEQKIQRVIKHRQEIKQLIKAVDGYFKQANLPDEHREKLISILEKRVNFKPDTDHIYIHPDPKDYEMFFVDHFSLNPDILSRIIKIGFKSALRELRKHDI